MAEFDSSRLDPASTHRAPIGLGSQEARSYDSLTGLASRSTLIAALAEAARHTDPPAVVAFFDLDRFRRVNDLMGHRFGDDVLTAVGARLVARIGSSATIGRIGGDEFVIVGAPGSADEISDSLRSVFTEPFAVRSRSVRLGASIGIVDSTVARDAEQLLQHADLAANEAKIRGGGQICRATSELLGRWSEMKRLERELEASIETCRFIPHVQPIVDPISGEVCGHEVLARWQREDGSVVAANVFLPPAQAVGALPRIFSGVREQALALAAARPGTRLSLNISVQELLEGDLPEVMEALCEQYGVDPDRLVIEVTEEALIEDDPVAQRVLQTLADRGHRISLDDFGSGYSSLALISSLPVHEVKLDRSFLRRARESDRGRQAMQAVCALLRQLELDIVIEGVEDPDDLALCRELGVAAVQGYYTGRPGPPELVIDGGAPRIDEIVISSS